MEEGIERCDLVSFAAKATHESLQAQQVDGFHLSKKELSQQRVARKGLSKSSGVRRFRFGRRVRMRRECDVPERSLEFLWRDRLRATGSLAQAIGQVKTGTRVFQLELDVAAGEVEPSRSGSGRCPSGNGQVAHGTA